MDFEKNLKEARIKAGLTQDELAKRLNMSKRTYEGWEVAKGRPKYEVLKQIKEILNCSYDDLLK